MVTNYFTFVNMGGVLKNSHGNEATGNHVCYSDITDEENYAIFDAMGVPRATDGAFKKGSEAPFSSDGMALYFYD